MNRRPHPIRSLSARAVGAMLLLVVAPSLWTGCSPEKDYKVLSFFFDGVPNPTQSLTDGAGGAPGSGRALMMVIHKPYADGKCNECHPGNVGALYSPVESSISSTVCLKCHQDVPLQYPVMHGPVAAVECLWCHDPHESAFTGMLKQAAPAVCEQCHLRSMLSQNPPEHQIPEASCLVCHTAHGGQKHGLLRPDRPIAPPATAPATAPAQPAQSGGAI